MHHVSWGNLCIVLTRKALGETRATTEKCFLWKNLCCLRNCKAFGGSRCSVSVHACYSAHHFYLHRPGKHSQDLDMFKYRRIEVEIKTRCCIIYLCGETCIIYLLVRPWARREWRLENASWRTCVVYLIERPSVGRGLRLDDISCILGGQLALFTYLYVLGWDESYPSKKLHVKNLCCLLNCKAFGGSRVKTRWCIMYLGGQLALCTYLLGLGWEKSHTKKILVQNLCCLLYRKSFGGLRVRTRWWIMYLEETCVIYFLVRPWTRRELRLEMFLVKNLCCLLNCKAFGGSRVKARWCILYLEETCAIYLLVSPGVRRELRVENDSCEELVLFT